MSLHPQSVAALALWGEAPPVHTLDAEGIRARRATAREEGLAEPKEDVAQTTDVDAGGVPARLLRPHGADPEEHLPALVYLHGGGFVLGDLETHDAPSRRLANRTGRVVLVVDYRRPPEHVFPAALVDSVAALDWMVAHGTDHGVDVRRVGVVGDSAGANLAIGTALRRPGVLEAAVLVYPFLDPEASSASYASTTGGLDREDGLWFWRQYVEPGDDRVLRDPELAPLRSTRLGELPRSLVQIAGEDTLVDEGRALVERARDLGADVTELTYDGMVHGFWRHPAVFDAAEQALADAADWLDRP
ncbi:alpha/beta hydrolase fold domain-containing protein [Nocardioides sp. HDW12B]|uniref:alpha/beta hydrolase n=1 Tax=Nocardioides sp. HDW12B TaxID=2714939 RepID=UPI00140A174F|nr:alpha/beta hydrolase [Nocardioides sp. HDW12B]QIK65759.1 alpha/beta hydrolase fold domain-containing protein [Nocardioides sp. HDW12B]